MTMLCLGRLGDIINASMICYHEHLRTNQTVRLIVAKEFAPLLLGFSYIHGVEFDGTQDELVRAMQTMPYHEMKVLQSWKNPDQSRQTRSYQVEAWRRAGKLDAFGTVPLVIDRRDKEREAKFCANFPKDKPLILVATQSPSSPFKWADALVKALFEAFNKTHLVVDISLFHAARPYDLLGLFDRAELLVTIDSFPLHLSRASKVPVIAILNDLGSVATPGSWAASVPPPQAVKTYRYSDWASWRDQDADEHYGSNMVIETVKAVLMEKEPAILHAVDMFGKEPRHDRACASWPLKESDWFRIQQDFKRSSKGIGDSRELPYLKDCLQTCMGNADDADVIFWCNSDNWLSPELPAFLRKHVPLYGACSFRRTEPGSTGVHCGADAFAFTNRWLTEHWSSIPDYLLGNCMFDIGLRALIRLQRGVVTTKQNLTTEFHPCDVGEGFVHHEAHPSAWAKDESSPGNRYNRRLFRAWSKTNLPALKFTSDDNLA